MTKVEDIDKLPAEVIDQIVQGRVVNSRCNACTHPERRMIDKLCITSNVSHREIAKLYGLSHQGVSNHAKNHISYETAAIRAIILKEAAELGADIEEGIRGELSRKVFLETIIQRANEALIDNELPVTAKDAMTAIEMIQKKEEERYSIELARLNGQFEAFQSAMKELVDSSQWYEIVKRAKDIYEGKNGPVFFEAEVVETDTQSAILTSGE